MAYVINEPCIGTKGISCVEVCPVDCIHPTPDEPGFDEADQLYIDPEECIDCDACVEACPVDAIASEDQVPPERRHYIQRNAASGHVHHRRGPDPPIRPARVSTSCPMSVAIAQWRSCSGGS
jgi:ferredoxin